MREHEPTAWERSMRPRPSIPVGLAHFAAELFGSLFVIMSTFGLIAAVVLVGGGTGGGSDRFGGLLLATVSLPVFWFGRYLITQHSVSSRRPDDDDDGGRGPDVPLTPVNPHGPSLRQRHVYAGRRPAVGPVRTAPRKATRTSV